MGVDVSSHTSPSIGWYLLKPLTAAHNVSNWMRHAGESFPHGAVVRPDIVGARVAGLHGGSA